MKQAIALLVLAACATPPRAPLDPTTTRAAVLEMAEAVQVAAQVCTHVARYLGRMGEDERADKLVADCTRHIIPARDAVMTGADGVDPWKPGSEATAGCAGKAVLVGLDAVLVDLRAAGYRSPVPVVIDDGRKLGARLEAYALPSCDPLHPTTVVTTYESPNIAPVVPVPPGVW